MNRSLTTKEKFTFVILALIVVLALWYLFFYTPTQVSIESLKVQQQEIQDQTDVLNVQLATYRKWQDELGLDLDSTSDDFAKIADYNNIRELTAELNAILAESTSYSMSFAQLSTPEEQGKDCYRRDVKLTFATRNYEAARSILKKLNESQYGCLLQDLAITDSQDSDGENSVSVNASISFFEYSKRAAVAQTTAEA